MQGRRNRKRECGEKAKKSYIEIFKEENKKERGGRKCKVEGERGIKKTSLTYSKYKLKKKSRI